MTLPEHTLVGIHLAFAVGCQRRFGWVAVALAGIASNLPDWDGIPMLFDMQRFEAGHRVWGHNLLVIAVTALLLSWTEMRFGWIELVSRWLLRMLANLKLLDAGAAKLPLQATSAVSWTGLVSIAALAQLIHLPCDMFVSGGRGLNHWGVQPFWPLSPASYVFPLIPWGDIGPTVILMAGIIAVAKYPGQLTRLSAGTLVLLAAYLLLRGWMRGAIGL